MTRGHLNNHMETHILDKPFKCTFEGCLKEFAKQVKLDAHMKIHTGEKRFICEVCQKAFHEKGNLKTHMRIHTGEKPYHCEELGCGQSFTTQGHLNDHKKKHETGISTFKKKKFGGFNLKIEATGNYQELENGFSPNIAQTGVVEGGSIYNQGFGGLVQ